MRWRFFHMRLKKRCRYCPELFTPDPRRYRPRSDGKGQRSSHRRWRRSSQVACAKPECQRQRHRDADRHWHRKNPTYDDERAAYLHQWRTDHAGYWKEYRAGQPDYVQRNREKQRRRDHQRKNLAKQDVIDRLHAEKWMRMERLIDLAKQDVIKTPPLRVSVETVRYLRWSYSLAKQDVIALQKKIAHNRGHEPAA